MSNAKKGFVLYFDSCPMLEALPPEQRGPNGAEQRQQQADAGNIHPN